jgi:hypothetical protein
MDTNLGSVNPINQDPSLHRIHESQNTHGQRRLATTRPSQETYPLPRTKLEGNILQHWRKLRGILDYQIFDANQRVRAGARGPVRRWTVRFNDGRRFLGEIEILDNTLDRADRENVSQTKHVEHTGSHTSNQARGQSRTDTPNTRSL